MRESGGSYPRAAHTLTRLPTRAEPGAARAIIAAMARILVLQHDARQTPGRLGMTLRDHGFKLDVRRVDLAPDEGGDALPADLDGVHGVISLGGPQNTDQSLPWMAREMDLIAQAHARALPVVGVCLGAHLVAKALGGAVEPMDTPEVGFTKVRVLPPGQTDIILAGVPWDSHQYQSHAWQITKAPPGAQVLASSDACKVQCFRAGMRTFAFQYHLELDRPGVEAMASDQSELLERAGVTEAQIDAQCERHYARFAQINDRLCVNLASYAFPFSELLAV